MSTATGVLIPLVTANRVQAPRPVITGSQLRAGPILNHGAVVVHRVKAHTIDRAALQAEAATLTHGRTVQVAVAAHTADRAVQAVAAVVAAAGLTVRQVAAAVLQAAE